MPFADSRGVRIHYRIEGGGPPLVLQHGFTQSIEDWYECGYVDALKRDYRLLLVDARGHGGSDKPHDTEAYSLDSRAGDVVAVLDALAIEKASFWGYSMGGWIGFGMAQFAPSRLDRLVIGGQHPFARSMEGTREMVRAGIERGGDGFIAAWQRRFGPAEAALAARLRRADFRAYLAAAQDRASLEDLLPQIPVQCCLYAGEADDVFAEARTASQRIPGATFFALPGLDHAGAFVRTDLVLPPVTRFLRGTAREPSARQE